MSGIPDEELMMRFQQGSAHAFELLFEKYRCPVFTFLCRMLGQQRAAAEDLLQEVFVRVAKAKELYEPRARFSTWLFTVARNHCINFIRSRRYLQNSVSLSMDEAPEGPGSSLADRLPGAEDGATAVARSDLQAELEHAICALPTAYREAFLLHAVEGFSHEEAARILDLKPATVRTHFHRARGMLRESMKGTFPEYGGQE